MKHLDSRNKIGLGLLILSIVLLIPGLLNNMFTLDISISIPILGEQNLHNETRSIMGTIGGLFENGNPTVAILILLFSVIVPFAKAVTLLVAFLLPDREKAVRLHAFVGLISKWSMADVFVVGVLIAFLSTSSQEQISAYVHSGFYFFTAYCLTSIAAVQILRFDKTT
ncbi:MAG: paraquat-inducible protein A [Bacteroidota bacterium]